MSTVSAVRRRIDPASLTALVAVGDLVCIAVFVFGGAAGGHGFDPVAQFARVGATYVTFLAGWLPAAVLAGAYAADARASPRRALATVVPAWVGAAVVAQLLRATSLFPGDAALTFFLVSVGVGLALLGAWRVAVAWLVGE